MLRVAGAIDIQYHCQGESFDKATEPAGLRILRSGAVDIRDSDNKLLDRLGEGESFHIVGLNAERGEVQATVIEDALCYLLPDEHYQALRASNRDFDRYFSGQRNRRLRRAARYEPETNSDDAAGALGDEHSATDGEHDMTRRKQSHQRCPSGECLPPW